MCRHLMGMGHSEIQLVLKDTATRRVGSAHNFDIFNYDSPSSLTLSKVRMVWGKNSGFAISTNPYGPSRKVQLTWGKDSKFSSSMLPHGRRRKHRLFGAII